MPSDAALVRSEWVKSASPVSASMPAPRAFHGARLHASDGRVSHRVDVSKSWAHLMSSLRYSPRFARKSLSLSPTKDQDWLSGLILVGMIATPTHLFM